MPRALRRTALALLALAPAMALSDGEGDATLEVLEHEGRCTRALVRGDDWTRQCAPMVVRARYQDGHQTVLFFIQGAAELSFRVYKEFRKEPGLHVLLVDQLRLKKARHAVPGFCTVTGAFTHPSRLAFDGPVTLRCRAGTAEEGDLADVTFQAEPARTPARR